MRIFKWSSISSLLLIIVVLHLFYLLNCGDEKKEGADLPLNLNVTYATNIRDLNEMKKNAQENNLYRKRLLQVKTKFERDLRLLESLINVQNVQIQKLNEVTNINQSVITDLANRKQIFRTNKNYKEVLNNMISDEDMKVGKK